jgi:hypothetical protein
MRNIILALAAMAVLATTPVSAQARQSWHHRHHTWHHRYHAPAFSFRFGPVYAKDCRVTRTKRVRPNGTVVIRRIRRCY